MIPHNINRERFDYLIGQGLKPGELKGFFREKKQRLIMCGVKVQNPPQNASAAKLLVYQFSEEAHRVLGAWIQDLPDEECTVGPDQWIPRYRAIEEHGVTFTAEDMAAMARAGLKELYKENPRDDWIQFLSTAPKQEKRLINPTDVKRATPGEDEWVAFGEWLCGTGNVERIENSVLRDAIALVAMWDRRALPIEVTTSEGRRALSRIEKLIDDTDRITASGPTRRGLRTCAPPVRAREEDVDYLELRVLATRVHSPQSGPFMARVEAFVDDSGAFRLDEAGLREVIRTDGRIAIFTNRGLPEPRHGEAMMYRIESHATPLPVKVRAKEALDSGLVPVVRLPSSTKEAHLIRRSIEEYARTPYARSAVFLTTDDVCVKPKVDSLARLSARDYDWTLDTWAYLDGVELPSGTYVLSPLPPPTGRLSCAPLAAAAVKLLSDVQRRGQANLTKAQANTLQDMLRDESLGIDDLSRARLADNLQSLSAAGEDYEELVRLLMTSAAVRSDVDRQVELRVSEIMAEKEKEQRSIASLQQERERLVAKLNELKAEVERRTRDVRAAVAKAFRKASEKEIQALGDSSVLLALMERRLPVVTRTDDASESATSDNGKAPRSESPRVSVAKMPPSGLEVRDVLRKFGFTANAGERVERVLHAAIAASFPIVARGSAARVLAVDLALALSAGEADICEVPIGLIENERLETQLRNDGNGAVLLLDGNLSDISVYAPGILDSVVSAAIGGQGWLASRPLVIALSSGPASLPLPAELQELAVKLDLNVLEGEFATEGRRALMPQGAIAKRAMKRFDADSKLSKLDLTSAVLNDLNWLLALNEPSSVGA